MNKKIFISASRVGPFFENKFTFENRRYEEVHNGWHFNLSQRTGLMAIYDDASNERLAIISIYDEARNPIIEEDVQDVFMIRFELDEAKREILIENERHKFFIYSIDSGTVRALQ